jgi:CheY-like chemotaxis protein
MNCQPWRTQLERSGSLADWVGMIKAPSPTVLVVDDEGIVRLDAAEGLREAGFEVVEAADADEALTAMEARDDIGVLFTDIEMPGRMNGLELARRVQHRRPRVRLLLTSGAVRIDPADMPDAGAFLRKPYSADAVARTIRRLLA